MDSIYFILYYFLWGILNFFFDSGCHLSLSLFPWVSIWFFGRLCLFSLPPPSTVLWRCSLIMTFSAFRFGEAGCIFLAFILPISIIITTVNNNIYNYGYKYRHKKKHKLLKRIPSLLRVLVRLLPILLLNLQLKQLKNKVPKWKCKKKKNHQPTTTTTTTTVDVAEW